MAKTNNGQAMTKRTKPKPRKSSVVGSAIVKKRGPGKPRKKITPAQIKKMQELAYGGCQNNTIATLMGFDKNLIDQRKDIRDILSKKRAERKAWLRSVQDYRVEFDPSPVMAIFIGKNELGQSDKQEIAHSGSVELKEPVIK